MDKYKVIEKEFIDELKSEAILFEHEKTKARVLKIRNDDENKAFGIGFRTVQNDDTGVCHILEHSVLSGSRKFKTKEPFMDLVKSSLQTFVNAMTFDDKTIYPISSRNEKDFYNLMDVYLDSVLHPDIYNNEKIFMQEGWHYELADKDSPITVNGVVYNEMKGAMSSDISQVMDKIARYLYKDSTYSTNSGGDPEFIPTLTREALLNYHTEKYHPSNSYIFIYGNGDTEKELDFIANYLDEFDYKEVENPMKYIKPLSENVDVETTFFGEEKPNNDFFAVSYVTSDSTDNLNNLCHQVLTRALVTEEGAPIRDRILSSGLATDVETMYSVGTVNNFSVIAKGMDAKDKDKILEIIDEEINKVMENGLKEKTAKSLLHQIKYEINTYGDTPLLGVLTYIRAFNTWLYDKSPLDALKYADAFKKLEENPSILKDYANKYFKNYRLTLLARPDKDLGKKREEKLAKLLSEYKDSLSDAAIEELIEKTKDLHEFQLREDSEENKKTIPKLDVKDLKDTLEAPNEIVDKNISSSVRFTGGITYLESVVPFEDKDDEKLQALTLVSSLIDRLDTDKYNYKDLNTEINLVAFDFKSDIAISKFYNQNKGMVFLSKRLSSDSADFKDAFELYNHTHLNTDFSNAKRIKEILNTTISNFKLDAVMTGVQITLKEALKDVNRIQNISEKISGASYCKYLEKISKLGDDELVKYLNEAYESYKEIFNRPGFYHITSDKEGIEIAKDVLASCGINNTEAKKIKIDLENKVGTTSAIVAMTDVNYCVDAAYFEEAKGSDTVVRNLIANNYLHDNIRAKGGAYGDGINQMDDLVYFFSYRDPNLENTFKVYDETSKWIREKTFTQEEINELIIGSYNRFDQNLTPRMRSIKDFMNRIMEVKHSDLEERLKEALNTTPKDVEEFANRLEKAMANKGRAVFTNDNGYERTKDMWSEKTELK